MNLEKFTLQLHNVLLSFLLSENLLLKYKHLYFTWYFYSCGCDTFSATLRKGCRLGLGTVLISV